MKKATLYARVIHRLRRKARERLFSDLGLTRGDSVRCSNAATADPEYAHPGDFQGRVKDFAVSLGRRYVILDNCRIRADISPAAPLRVYKVS